MPTLKKYSRADHLDEFVDQCEGFYDGGIIDGIKFDFLGSDGAMDALWKDSIETMVRDVHISSSALKWKPLTEVEKADVLERVSLLLAPSNVLVDRPVN